MSRAVYIYVINDPRTGLVRYVGKTINPHTRFKKHLTHKKITLLSKWISGMKAIGLLPSFEIIDECNECDWQEKERQYILLFKSIGARLLNQMPGGEGGATFLGKSHTTATKIKMSLKKKGVHNNSGVANALKYQAYKVDQFKDGVLIATHPSIKSAARTIGRSFRRIQMMVTGTGEKVNHVAGFTFKLAENEVV